MAPSRELDVPAMLVAATDGVVLSCPACGPRVGKAATEHDGLGTGRRTLRGLQAGEARLGQLLV